MMTFDLPIPISDNDLYFQPKTHKHRIKAPEARDWEMDAFMAINEQIMANRYTDFSWADKKLVCTVEVFASNWICKNKRIRKRDISNTSKLLLDTLFRALALHSIAEDDSQVWELRLVKQDCAAGQDRSRITLEPL